MFLVSTIKNKNISKTCINKEKKNIFSTPIKEKKNIFSTPIKEKKRIFPFSYSLALQTNNSFYSSSTKGGSFNDSNQEPIIIENNQEIPFNNEFLGKKTKFKVNYIESKGEKNANKNMEDKIEVKEMKNKNNNKFVNIVLKEGRWNNDEHLKFLEAIYNYNNNWKEVQKYIGTRTPNQVRSHAQKFILKLRTFKDPSLGVDFTEENFKNLKEIINKIKEIEENNQKKNILLLLNERLSENIIKNNQNIDINNKKEENKTIFINNKNNENLNANMNYNIKKENLNKPILNKEKKYNNLIKKVKFKNEKLNEKNEEKSQKEKVQIIKIQNEKTNKEILEEKKQYYYDYEEQNYLNTNYEIIDDIIYEINETNKIDLTKKNKNPLKELNTISIINSGYFC